MSVAQPNAPPKQRRKGSVRTTHARTREVARALLEGVLGFDIAGWIREQEANPTSAFYVDDESLRRPLCDESVRIYIRKAEALVADSFTGDRQQLLAMHLARREDLYRRAMAEGAGGFALEVLKDSAKLVGLYAPDRTEHTGANGAALPALSAMVLAIIQAENGEGHEQQRRVEGNGVGGPPVPALADLLRDEALQDPCEP